MAMNMYSTFSKAQELNSHHQMQFSSVISKTLVYVRVCVWGGSYSSAEVQLLYSTVPADSRFICSALHPTFKIDIDCEEELPLQLQMGLIDLQCLEDLKSKFLASYILNFYKNNMIPCQEYAAFATVKL